MRIKIRIKIKIKIKIIKIRIRRIGTRVRSLGFWQIFPASSRTCAGGRYSKYRTLYPAALI